MKNYSHLVYMHNVLLPYLLFCVVGMQAVMEDLEQAGMHNAMETVIKDLVQDVMNSMPFVMEDQMQGLMELHKL